MKEVLSPYPLPKAQDTDRWGYEAGSLGRDGVEFLGRPITPTPPGAVTLNHKEVPGDLF